MQLRSWSWVFAACTLATLGCGSADGTIGGVDSVDPAGAFGFEPASGSGAEEGVEGENDGDDPGLLDVGPHDPRLPGGSAGSGSADPEPPPASEDEEPNEPPPAKPAVAILDGESDRQLAAMKTTVYQHTTSVDESTGTFKYDCSGFLGYALRRVLPEQFEAIQTWNRVERPLAKHFTSYYASIEPGKVKGGWTRVARAIDLVPGDVVAWLKPADLVSANTGHVMIVRAAPKKNPARGDEVLVPITDSTASPHGSTDSRWSDGDGLGTGTIGLIVDGKGAPIRYRWSGGKSTTERTTLITLGRPM